jgi:hypothetical protein
MNKQVMTSQNQISTLLACQPKYHGLPYNFYSCLYFYHTENMTSCWTDNKSFIIDFTSYAIFKH